MFPEKAENAKERSDGEWHKAGRREIWGILCMYRNVTGSKDFV